MIPIFSVRPHVNSAIFAILSVLSQTISMSLAKQLDPELPTALVLLIRSTFGLLFFIPILIANKSPIAKTKKLPLHILRVILTVLSMLCTYYAYRNLPIAFATAIGMSAPFFATVLSIIFLKEQVNRNKWLLVLLGYIGVIIVVRPVSFFLDTGTIAALLANLLAAGSMVTVKNLSRHDSVLMIMLYANIGIMIVSFLLNIKNLHLFLSISNYDLLLVIIMGVLGVTTQLCITTALKYAPLSFVAPFEYTRIFFAFLIGVIVFNEGLDFFTILGSIVILFAAYMITYLGYNENNR